MFSSPKSTDSTSPVSVCRIRYKLPQAVNNWILIISDSVEDMMTGQTKYSYILFALVCDISVYMVSFEVGRSIADIAMFSDCWIFSLASLLVLPSLCSGHEIFLAMVEGVLGVCYHSIIFYCLIIP